MTHTETGNWLRNFWISALILLAIVGLTNSSRAQIVSTSAITASDGAANDNLGWSVSANGSYIAVSALNKTVGGNSYQGAVYIYSQTSTGWSQQAEITAPDGATFDEFGYSVCLSGTTLAVGAVGKTVNGNNGQGVVYIYTRSGSTWTQKAEIISADGAANDSFGCSVSLNGSNLAVGALDHGGTGAAYIFTHLGSSWTQKAEITAADGGGGDEFGFSVSLGGTTLAVGSPYHSVNGAAEQGAAYVYVHTGSAWTQQAELYSSDGAELDEFGYSVNLNGAILIAGAPFHAPSVSAPDQGAAYVFIRTGTTWTQQAEVMAPDGAAYDNFGWSVSFSGTTLAVSAPFRIVNGNNSEGTIYTFLHSGSQWPLQQELTEPDGAAQDSFGYSASLNGSILAVGAVTKNVNSNSYQGEMTVFVTGTPALTATGGSANDLAGYSVSNYGSTLAVGAPGKKINGLAYVGAVFVYALSGSTWTQQTELTAPDGASGDDFGYSVNVNGNTLVVGAPYHVVNGIESGAVYVYTLSGSTWTLQAELTATDASGGDNFGHAVSVNASTLAVGASYKTVGSNSHEGTVYIFNRSGSSWSQKAELTGQDSAGYDEFGYSVSLTSNGLAVGAPYHTVGSNSGQGVAYVFFRSNNVWSQSGRLTASDGGVDDYFGWSVGLETTATVGSTLVVGAPYHTVGSTSYQQGAVYSYFAPTIPRWGETAEIITDDGVAGDYFGTSLSFNGSNLIIGAPLKAIEGNLEQGAAYIYTLTGVGYGIGWNPVSELTAKDGKADDLFGYSVSVNGGNFAIGTPEHKVKSNSYEGVVYTLP